MRFGHWRRRLHTLHRLLTRRRPTYKAQFALDLPDAPNPKVIYLIGEDGVLWYAVMICPCGCGSDLRMSLHREGRPRWEVHAHLDGAVSLFPSVHRRVGCRSHFWVDGGEIYWVSSGPDRIWSSQDGPAVQH